MSPPTSPTQGYQWAVRVGTEMVVALIIGLAMGMALDNWLETKPWLTLLFFLFGVAAGFLNLYRAVAAPNGNGDSTGPKPGADSNPGTGHGN